MKLLGDCMFFIERKDREMGECEGKLGQGNICFSAEAELVYVAGLS